LTIHTSHPFADAEPDGVRRLRGRLGGAVTLWTAGSAGERAGLTVTSLMVANGEEPRVLALLDPDSDLAASLEATGAAVVQLLSWADRGLAEMFAGTAPAPGGPFRHSEFVDTDWGPRLASAGTWAGIRHETSSGLGWSRLVTCTIEHIVIGADSDPLGHRRGRFTRLLPPGP
jgi:flavin reductase (DIM6/NTAB) family NADH-FMN oxidoreductase RutF